MRFLTRRIPLAWLQLTHQKVRLTVAICGVVFASLLMLMQLGLKDSLVESASLVEQNMQGDLFLVDKRSKALIVSQPFSQRLLQQALSVPGVESVYPLMAGSATWKNPWTGTSRMILALGVDPERPVLRQADVVAQLPALRAGDYLLFDKTSRPEFGAVTESFEKGERVRVRIEDERFRVAGLIHFGSSFAADGNIVVSASAFRRMFPTRAAGGIDIGGVTLHSGESLADVKQALVQYLPRNLQVMTREETLDWERDYWGAGTTIGFIFQQGAVIGFIVGVVIVYQILYTDVSNHLPEYATLKAIGYSNRYLLGVVFQSAFFLSVLGYIPGLLLSLVLYGITEQATSIAMRLTVDRAALVFALTLGMCFSSGVLAVRKLRQADPAEVF